MEILNMEWLTNKLASIVIEDKFALNSEYKIYKFGFQVGIEFFLTLIMSCTIAICIDMLFEYLLFLTVFIPIRSYAGGFHFRQFPPCLVGSCILINCSIWISRFIMFEEIYCFLYTIILLALIYYCAPVEGINRQIDFRERKIFRKILIIILVCVGILSLMTLILKYQTYQRIVFISVLDILLLLLFGKFFCRKEVG